MISLERIVRPYQAPPGVAFGRIVSRTVAPSTDLATITWGDTGNLPTPVQEDVPNDGGGFNVEVCDTDYKETDRTVQPIRITNPTDENQFVVIDRVKSMSFKVTEKVKNAGAVRSETTSFPDTGFGGSLESVPKGDNCKSTFNLSGT